MTQSKARAFWSLIIWAPVLLLFILAFFFVRGGVSGFAGDALRIAAVAILFAAGYAAHFTMLDRTRAERGKLSRDERDDGIERRAHGVTLGLTLGYVFLVCIALWVAYQEGGAVPAGWLWFIAYSSVFLGFIVHALATLMLHAS